MKKMVILSPHIPPRHGGVSDFTLNLFDFLSSRYPVFLLSFRDLKRGCLMEREDEQVVYLNRGIWSVAALDQFIKQTKASIAIIQFTPWMYGLCSLQAAFLCAILKYRRIKIILHAHETSSLWDWRGLRALRCLVHRLTWRICLLLCDRVLLSTETETHRNKSRWPVQKNRFLYCPTPSNIEIYSESGNRQDILKKYGLAEYSFRFIVFGLPHNLKHRMKLIDEFIGTTSHLQDVGFVFIGPGREDFPDLFGKYSNAIALGYLPERDVSMVMQTGHVLLAPFNMGVSTKHGTVMCAFLHSLPVLTTSGPETDACFYERDLVELSPDLTMTFCEMGHRLMNNETRRKQIAGNAFKFYMDHCSFGRTMDHYQEMLVSLN